MKIIQLLMFTFISNISLFAQPPLNDPCTTINDYLSVFDGENQPQSRDFSEGWNMFGFPCKDPRSVSETFSEIESDLYIVKNNEGNFYWPEFDFDGIGELLPLEGYQTKLYNQVIDFSFCLSAINSINFPIVYGCTDCEADNFNPFANNDDESCEYLGCTDLTADNYEPNANTDDGSCLLHQYQIGDLDQGGMVFYVDESGQHGLVVSTEDYGGFLSTHEWGCNNTLFGSSSTQFYVGSGNQNTLNILSECPDTESAAAICDSYNINGFDDWYLPSRDELFLIYTNVAQGSFNNYIGGFSIGYWSSSAHSASEAHYFWFSQGTTTYGSRSAGWGIRPIRSF